MSNDQVSFSAGSYLRKEDFLEAKLLAANAENAVLRKKLETAEAKVAQMWELPDYGAGYLNTYGGGDVNWWLDYLRAEIERANEYWRAALNPEAGND